MSRLNGSSVVKGTMVMAAVVLIGLLLVGTLGALSNGSERMDAGAPIKTGINPGSPTQITSPFRINGDAELAAKASAMGWVGDGTASNPYIIYNVYINNNYYAHSTYGIFIGNTTKSFVIYQCYIYRTTDASSNPYTTGAINLYHVSNAQILSTSVSNAYNGIILSGCSNVSLYSGSCYDVAYVGVKIDNSNNITVATRNINYCRSYGIYLTQSQDVLLDRNNIYSANSGDGIYLYNSDNNRIENNSVGSSQHAGIELSSSDGNIVRSNTISGNYGIVVESSARDVLMYNTLSYGNNRGVHLISSNNITVEGNTANSWNVGMYSQSSSDVLFRNNTVNTCSFGIYLYTSSTRNILVENRVNGCGIGGITVEASMYNAFYNNTLTGTSFYIQYSSSDVYAGQDISTNNTVNGRPVYYYANVNMENASVPLDAGQVILASVQYLNVAGLNLSDQNAGLLMGYSSHIRVADNLFSGGNPQGVRAVSCTDGVFHNNTVADCNIGLSLYQSSSNVIDTNIVDGCSEGIVMESCSNNVISANVVSDCSESGIELSSSNNNALFENVLASCSINLEGSEFYFSSQDISTNNTVNGRPVYYYANVNMENASVPLGAGQVILASVQYAHVTGQNLSDQNVGLLIGYSSQILVDGNTIDNGSPYGARLFHCSDCLIEGNSLEGDELGIILDASSGVALRSNELTACGTGIYIHYCDAIEVSGSDLNADTGIDLYSSTSVMVTSNQLIGCGAGVAIYSSTATIEDNLFEDITSNGISVQSSNGGIHVLNNLLNDTNTGIRLWDSDGGEVRGNDISNSTYGIYVDQSASNLVTGNNVTSSSLGIMSNYCTGTIGGNNITGCGEGVRADNCSPLVIEGSNIARCNIGINTYNSGGVIVQDNDITDCETGVRVYYTSSADVRNNEIYGGDNGIYVTGSSLCNVSANNIIGCSQAGIFLYSTENNVLTGNALTACAINIAGGQSTYATQTIQATNTVNGKPVYYYKAMDMTSTAVPTDAGQVILGNVTNGHISGLAIDNTTVAVLAGYSDHVAIDGCSFDNLTSVALSLQSSHYFTVGQCEFTSCEKGVLLNSANGNLVDNCTFKGCTEGIRIESGNNNRMLYNTLSACDTGMYLYGQGSRAGYNTISQCRVGIDVRGTSIDVDHNTLSACSQDGVLFYSSSGEALANIISGCPDGIHLYQSSYSVVQWNEIGSCGVGINATQTYGESLHDNIITGAGTVGILLDHVEECAVDTNEISGCPQGLMIKNSVNVGASGNNIEGCHDGAVLLVSESVQMTWNRINGSSDMGVKVLSSEEVSISYNTISNSTSYGLWFNTSLDNEVYLNRFIDNNGAGEIYDPEHAQAYDDCYVYVDIFGPEITLYEPYEGQEVYGSFYTYWDAYDEAGVDHCEFRIDDGEWTIPEGEDSFFYYPLGLSSGEHKIEVRAWDTLGNSASAFANFTVEGGPGRPLFAWSAPSLTSQADPEDPATGSTTVWSSGPGNKWSDLPSPDSDRDGYIDVPYRIAGGNSTDGHPLSQEIASPDCLHAAAEPFSVTLTWSGYNYSLTGSIDGYHLTRNSATGGNFTVDLGASNTSYSDTTVVPYHVYTYTLVAFSGDVLGGEGQVEVMTPDPFPPSIVIDSPSNGVLTNASNMEVTWTGTDEYSGMAGYWVKLNDGEWVGVGMNVSHNFTGLSEGNNTLAVRAVANAGNVNETSVIVARDSTVPILSITAPSIGSVTGVDSVTAAWSATDHSGVEGYQYRLDGGEWSVLNATPGATFASLAAGAHTINVRAVDNAGNVATATVTFTVDLTLPSLSITSPANGTWVSSLLVTWQGSDDLSSVSSYEVSLDGGVWTDVLSATHYLFEDAADGLHTIQVRAHDQAGNNATAEVQVYLDTVAPVLAIWSPGEGDLLNRGNAQGSWEGTDEDSGVANYSMRVDGGEWAEVQSSCDLGDLAEGQHLLEVRAFDVAGNFVIEMVSFTLDPEAPVITERVPEGEHVDPDADVTVTFSEDMNVSSVNLTVEGVEGIVSWSGNTVTFDPSTSLRYATAYTVTVSGLDLAGNEVSVSWTFTTTNRGALSGRIVDTNGAPVANALVTLDTGETALTDENGLFYIVTEAGEHTITVTKDGYQATFSSALLGAGETLSISAITLTPQSTGSYDWWPIILAVAATGSFFLLLFSTSRNERDRGRK